MITLYYIFLFSPVTSSIGYRPMTISPSVSTDTSPKQRRLKNWKIGGQRKPSKSQAGLCKTAPAPQAIPPLTRLRLWPKMPRLRCPSSKPALTTATTPTVAHHPGRFVYSPFRWRTLSFFVSSPAACLFPAVSRCRARIPFC